MNRPSIKSLALEYLQQHTGKVCTRSEIEEYVRKRRGIVAAGDVTRRIRELRQHVGWPIETDKDAGDLSPGQYRLRPGSPVPGPARAVSRRTRYAVLERDGSTCQRCGLGAGEVDPSDARVKVRLVLDHRIPFPSWREEDGDWNGPENLVTLCHNCNGGKQAFFAVSRPAVDILQVVRASPLAIQKQVFAVLKHKFEEPAARNEIGGEGRK